MEKVNIRRNKIWKLASVLLLLIFGIVFSVSGAAEAAQNTVGEDGAWSLNLNTGELTVETDIKASGLQQTYPWSDYRDDIKKVTITGNATCAVGFSGCENLSSVVLSNKVTKIGIDAFSKCTSLTSITIPSSVTEIDSFAFFESGLISIEIPNSVTEVRGGVFSECSSLKYVKWSENADIMASSLFSGSGLVSITVPKGVTLISISAFYRCKALKEINVESGNEKYSSVNGVLFDGTELKNYPEGKTDTSYTIPEGITAIYNLAFGDGANFTSLTLPSTFTDIGKAVREQSGLYASASAKFYYCDKLQTIHVKAGNTVFSSENGVLYNKDKSRLILYPAGKKDSSYEIPDSVTEIEANGFYGNPYIKDIIFPENSTGGITLHSTAITKCSALKQLYIPSNVNKLNWLAVGYDIDALTAVDSTIYERYKNQQFAIVGFTGSAAETYANDNNITFKAVHYVSFANISESYEKKKVINGEKYGTLPIPQKEGYTFEGWFTSEVGGSQINENSTVSVTGDQTLYAHWKSGVQAPEVLGQPVDVEEHYGDPAVFTVSANTAECQYQWYQASGKESEGTVIEGATEYRLTVYATNETADRYYYCKISNDAGTAVSERARLRVYYNITYNGNGSQSFLYPQRQYYNEKMAIYAGIPEMEGHTFLGWSKNATSAEAEYTSESEIMPNRDITLYAVWVLNSYTISYEANGGEGAPAAQTKYYGINLTLSKTVPVRDEYIFAGWSSSSVATVPAYAPGGIYTTNSDITLYAVWTQEPDNMPVITTQPENVTAHTGTKIQFMVEAQGKHLTYQWYYVRTESSDTPVPVSGAKDAVFELEVSGSLAGRKYYCAVSNGAGTAMSEAAEVTVQYAVNFDANGGYNAPETQYQTQDKTIQLATEKPERNEYEFIGWSLSRTGTVVYMAGSDYQGNMDITLYAVWKKVTTTPSTEPTTPSTEPDTPSTEPDTTPSTKPTTPATEPTTPSTPATEPTTPSTPATEPTTPSTPATEPTTPTTPATEPTMPSTPSTEPSTPATEPTTPSAPATNPPTPSPAPSQPSVTPPSGTVNSQTAQPVSNGKKTITRKYKKNQKFSLGVKVTGKTTYKTSNKKVVAVDKKGKAQIKGCGRATVTIKQKGKAAQKVYITIIPSAVSVSAKSPKAGQLLISWKRNSSVSGYQIQYSTSKEFLAGDTRTGTAKSNKLTKTTVKNLKRGTTYYVRVRTYKKASGGTVYSAWSSVKKGRIK